MSRLLAHFLLDIVRRLTLGLEKLLEFLQILVCGKRVDSTFDHCISANVLRRAGKELTVVQTTIGELLGELIVSMSSHYIQFELSTHMVVSLHEVVCQLSSSHRVCAQAKLPFSVVTWK